MQRRGAHHQDTKGTKAADRTVLNAEKGRRAAESKQRSCDSPGEGLKGLPYSCSRSGRSLATGRPVCILERMDYRKIIMIEPGKRGGKPCIRGLRVTVYDVLDYLAAGLTHEQILKEFPYLTEDDIRACLAYAADRERKLVVAAG